MPRASVSPSANGCQNGKYLVPHRARNGRSRKKYPPVGMPWVLGMGESWSQIVGSVETGVAVVVPVGPRRVLVEPVRERLARERAEVAVQHRVVLGQGADDREVGDGLAPVVAVEVGVVPDREGVGRGQGHARVARAGRWAAAGTRPSGRRCAGPGTLPSCGRGRCTRSPGSPGPAGSWGRRCRRSTGRLMSWRPSAPGSQPRKWSKDRFSIISTTTCSMPFEPCGRLVAEALAAAWDRSSVPVIAMPAEAPMSLRKFRRVSMCPAWGMAMNGRQTADSSPITPLCLNGRHLPRSRRTAGPRRRRGRGRCSRGR